MPQGNLFSQFKSFNNAGLPARLGQQGDAWYSHRHGVEYNSTYGTPTIGSVVANSGMVFRGSNQTAAAVTAALATTYTGICLSNPAASTVNLVVKGVTGIFGPAPATAVNLGLITGWAAGGVTVHTTAITQIVNAYVGAATSGGSIVQPAASQAKLDAACTLVGTPAWDRWLTATAASGTGGQAYMNLNDSIIIPPGGYCAVGNLVAVASGFLGTFVWEELAP